MLRPGGRLVCTFSNRVFATKAVRGWLFATDDERCAIVAEYFRQSKVFASPTVGRRTPLAHPGDPLSPSVLFMASYSGFLATVLLIYAVIFVLQMVYKNLSPGLQKVAHAIEPGAELHHIIQTHLKDGHMVVAMSGGGGGSVEHDDLIRRSLGRSSGLVMN